MRNNKRKICFVLTAEFALKAFLRDHIQLLTSEYEITVVVNTNNKSLLNELGLNARLIPLNILRKISLLHDLKVLFQLIRLFSTEKYDAVHSVTPKAGLLAMLAAFLTLTKVRVHTFTGQVWATKTSFLRAFLKTIDQFTSGLSTHIIIDSLSQKKFLLENKIIEESKALVFGSGSIAGVNLNKFKFNQSSRNLIREKYKIHEDTYVFLYLGRLTHDKGIIDLVSAFNRINSNKPLALLLVGPDEQNLSAIIEGMNGLSHNKIQLVKYTNTPEMYFSAADVLCLPSYREGFGSVIIEAAACGIPAIASNIYGITDAIKDHETGLLHEVNNIYDLQKKMELLISDTQLGKELGAQARLRAEKEFDSHLITSNWLNFYRNLIKDNNETNH